METTADAKETLRKFFAEHAETELTKGETTTLPTSPDPFRRAFSLSTSLCLQTQNRGNSCGSVVVVA